MSDQSRCIARIDYDANNNPRRNLFGGGYCQAKPAGGPIDTFAFYFYNRDHLGNVREVVSQSGAICQVSNYYPFGTPYSDSSATISPEYQPYKYNGKELDLMHGLNAYDYDARQYNPILPVWDRVDPLAEKYYSISPYAYCGNNPVNAYDPYGMKVRDGTGTLSNARIKKLAKFLSIHDDPNSIMILAHGIYNKGDRFASKVNIQTYNFKTKEWQNNFISNGKQLYFFLIHHSKTWKKFMNDKIDPSNLHIVFYSCGSSSLIRKLSSFSAFKDITFIAPDRKLRILNSNNETEISDEAKDNYNNHIKNFGTWRTFKNGKEPMINGNYNGNNKPGTKGFKYESTFFYR
ncbi:MAG: RHS repeat-associated core domain-containing protein [Prevotella sp.]|nr:RHS repeat-associated core domain-containing protein [Prevotella sp.]